MRQDGVRRRLLASAVIGLALASVGAMAQGYDHGPVSDQASHTPGSMPHSEIAPRLPEPMGGEAGGPEHFLREADRALTMHKSGLAQQSLEMAETRLLDRSTIAAQAQSPDMNPEIQALHRAREALGRHDMREAHMAIREALNDTPQPGGPGMPPPGMGMPPPPPSTGMPPPPGT